MNLTASRIQRRRSITVWLTLLITCAAAFMTHRNSRAQAPEYRLPPGFTLRTVVSGLDRPTAIDFLPDGTLLIAEQAGVLKGVRPGESKTYQVLNLSEEVNSLIERGMTGLAVDPQFAAAGFIYLLYTYDAPGEPHSGAGLRTGHLARFTMRDGIADPSSRQVLLDGFESDVPFHSAGTVRFGKAGELFVSFGDSSDPYTLSELPLRTQDLGRLQGKIVRIDREGNALTDNPFYDPAQPDAVRSKVFAYGFRNPFRLRVHPSTGTVYAGNVGWQTIESLVRVQRGGNFGWPCYESYRPVAEFANTPTCAALPAEQRLIADYDYLHNADTASITAGDFADAGFPEEMRGNFFFGDYAKQWIRRAQLDADGRIVHVADFGEGLGFHVDMAFGPDGALYTVDYLGGAVKRIAWAPDKHAPKAKLEARLTEGAAASAAIAGVSGPAPLDVTFSAVNSTDEDGSALRYVWEFERTPGATSENALDLQFTMQPTVTHRYEKPGSYVARLRVVDEDDWTDQAQITVTVIADGPVVEIESPGAGASVRPGDAVVVRGSAVDASGRPIPAESLRWSVDRYDGWWNRRRIAAGSGPDMRFIMPPASVSTLPHRLEHETDVLITLWAKDAAGRESHAAITLHPTPHDGYIRTWWLIGGFPQRSLSDDVLPKGEATYRLRAPSAEARLFHGMSRKIDLSQSIRPAESTMAYAFIWVHSPSDRKALLGMSSDDGIAVWLNGEEVWRNSTARYVTDNTRDVDLPAVQLRAGANALLVKVDQKFGEWAFKLRILHPNGTIMRDVTTISDSD